MKTSITTIHKLLAAALMLAPLAGPAQESKSVKPPANFDVRLNASASLGSSMQGLKSAATLTRFKNQTSAIVSSLADLEATTPNLEITRSPLTGGVELLGSPTFLTPPAPGRTGAQIVLDFYRDNKALFGLTDADVDQLYVIGESFSPSGLRTVRVEQRIGGIPVFQSETRVTLSSDGRIARLVGSFVPNAIASVVEAANPISAQAALEVAMQSVSVAVDAAQMSLVNTDVTGNKTEVVPNDEDVSGNVTSFKVYFLAAPGTLVPAWSQVAYTSTGGAWYTLVDAGTSSLLWRKTIKAHASTEQARFSVYVQADGVTPADSPSPLSPTTVTPGSGTQPPEIARTTVNMLTVQSATASPNGWITDGGTTTNGNNVHAYMDADATLNTPDTTAAFVLDGAGKPTGNPDSFTRNRDFLGTTPRDFSGGFNPPPQGGNSEAGQTATGNGNNGTLAIDSYRRGSVTQAFYTTNWYHDQLHALGFDQAAGNFQVNNFGGGGVGNDPVLAETQDASGTNNANFATPPDGQSGRMQMFRFTGPTIDRDSNLDSEILIHELTHGLSNRLVGNGAGLNWDIGGSLGEGWSDFYALSLLNRTNADDPNARYAAGGYATFKLAGLLDNHLYGIRRFPYSTDNAVNPLTWADVDQTTNNMSGGIAPSPLNFNGGGALEVHNAGEIWCNTLWEVRSRIIADPAGANGDVPTGNQTTLQIVTDAMKLTPINPSFIEARDAVLAADFAASAGVNEESIWAGFADRGLGYNAACPNKFQLGSRSSYLGVRESFDLPYLDVMNVAINDAIGNNNGALDPNEPVQLTVTLKNPWKRSSKGVASATAVLSSSTPGVVVTDANSTYGAIAALGNAAGDSFQITVPAGATAGQRLDFTLTVTSSLGTKAVNFSRRVGTPGGAGATQTFSRTSVSLAIPDNNGSGVTDTLNIPTDLDIMDVDFRIDSLTHTFPGDLFIGLRGPSGYGFTPIGWIGAGVSAGSGDNITNVTVSDGAAGEFLTLANAAAPYTGTYSPVFNSGLWPGFGFGPADAVGQLSGFNNSSSLGSWKVVVSDQVGGDTGTLNSWSLIITPRSYTVTPFVFVPPEIVVEQPVGTGLTDNVSTTSFTTVIAGSIGIPKTYTITNLASATGTLTGIAVTLAGANPTHFSLNTTGMATSLAPGASTTFTVAFSPLSVGAKSATIQIASNDSDENPFDIFVDGTGAATAATFSTTQTITIPDGTTSMTVEAWGGGGNGGTSNASNGGTGGGGGAYAGKIVSVTPGEQFTVNVGAAAQDSTVVRVTGAVTEVVADGGSNGSNSSTVGGAGGTIAGSLGTTLRSGGNGGFTTANPGSGGGGSGSPSANGGDGLPGVSSTGGAGGTGTGIGGQGGANNTNGLAGNAPGGGGGGGGKGGALGGAGAAGQVIVTFVPVAPEINVKGNSQSIVDGDITPDSADHTDFGSVTAAGGGTVVRTFTIENLGMGNLALGTVNVTGTGFSLTNSPAITIGPGLTTTFQVTFDPTTVGLSNGTVSFSHNDTDENPYNFAIQGTGLNSTPDIISNGGLATASVSIPEGSTAVTDVDATDADTPGQTLTYSKSGVDQSLFNIDSGTGVLTFASAPDFESPTDSDTNNVYLVTVTATDNGSPNLSDSQDLSITITDAIEPPVITSLSTSLGSVDGSYDVTINGTLFTGVTSVTFGGTAASVQSATATAIVARVPAHARGLVNVVVTTPGGSGTGTGLFTYVANPTVTASFGAAQVSIGGAATLTYTLTNNDPDVALTGFAFNDGLPDGLAIATPNGLVNSAGGTATAVAGSQSFSYSGGSVPAGGTATVSINITGTVLGVKKSQYIAATSTQADPINAPRAGGIPVYRTGIAPHTFGRRLLTGSIGAGDPTQTGRLFRNTVMSTIAAPKAFPGTNDTVVGRRFDSYTIVNSTTSPQPCEVWSNTSGVGGYVAAYLGSYNPANIATNYLADPGNSWVERGWFGFTIPASSTVVLVVHEITAGAGISAYALGVNTPLPPVTVANVPTFDAALPSIEVIAAPSGPLVFTGVPITVQGTDYIATGKEVPTREMNFNPTTGSEYVYIEVTGPSNVIIDEFFDLPDEGVIAMNNNGVIFYFQVDYQGGVDGNDLVFTALDPALVANWKWTAGPDKRNAAASFGLIDTPASTNNPGARQGAMQWLGQDGSLWLFGGYGYATAVTNPARWLNDLWQYKRNGTGAGQWIWRGGSTGHSALGNYPLQVGADNPGARHTGTTWTDKEGNLWLFGGLGYGESGAVGRLNDLWRYDVTTGSWFFLKGSSSTGAAGVYSGAANALTPGARQGSTSWTDSSGNLWLFGGVQDGTGFFFNDLWSFNTTTSNWTLVEGDGTTNLNGIYGTQGTPAALNSPGARRNGSGWVAKDGSLWLFGGQGKGKTTATTGDLNDLWRYDIALGQWEWVRGSDEINSAGSYGSKGTEAPSNDPPARGAGGAWTTVDGKMWLIGGLNNLNIGPFYNDIWTFNPSTERWTWQQGSNIVNVIGTYGTKDVAAPGNNPGARFTPSTWITLNGAIWVFGGGGRDAFGTFGRLSDLWRYGIEPPAGAPPESRTAPFPDSLIVNEAPNASDAAAGTMAYVPISGQLSATDADGDKVFFGSVSPTTLSQGTLTLNPDGTWSYTPAPGFVGQSTFQFKAADSYGGVSATRTLFVTVVTNPGDADNDGIADSYEQTHLGGTGADPLGDADADGQSNYFEYLAGTQPQDGNSYLTTAPSIAAATEKGEGAFKLELNHVRPGVNYHLETSTDLDVWTRIGTFTFNVSGSAIVEDPSPPTGQPQFYRMSLDTPVLLP